MTTPSSPPPFPPAFSLLRLGAAQRLAIALAAAAVLWACVAWALL